MSFHAEIRGPSEVRVIQEIRELLAPREKRLPSPARSRGIRGQSYSYMGRMVKSASVTATASTPSHQKDEKMLKRHRVFNIEGYLSRFCTEEYFTLGIPLSEVPVERLKMAGLNNMKVGEERVPFGFGPISKYNSSGKVVKLKNQPKKEVWQRRYYKKTGAFMGVWHLWMWQRQTLPPLRTPLKLVDNNGQMVLVSPIMHYLPEEEGINCHVVNLFLELAGKVEFYKLNGETLTYMPTAREVCWEIFPPGTSVNEKYARVLKKADEMEKKDLPSYKDNLVTLKEYGPADIAIGTRGLNGYFVYTYPDLGFALCESPEYGNATYVLPVEWEEISKQSKGEIIAADLCYDRIPHDNTWGMRIKGLMNG